MLEEASAVFRNCKFSIVSTNAFISSGQRRPTHYGAVKKSTGADKGVAATRVFLASAKLESSAARRARAVACVRADGGNDEDNNEANVSKCIEGAITTTPCDITKKGAEDGRLGEGGIRRTWTRGMVGGKADVVVCEPRRRTIFC